MQITPDYKKWLTVLKNKVRSAQIKAAIVVNSEAINFYWDIGKMISEKENVWGTKLIERVAKDLQEEFPDMNGLSKSNLKYCKRFYEFYGNKIILDADSLIGQQVVDQLQSIANQKSIVGQQLVDQIPWGHNILIFTKSKDVREAQFYLQQTIENHWSRDTLGFQIKSSLYERTGKSISNFKNTLPDPLSDLAQQTLKDPYIFDFLTLAKDYKERDIEHQLVTHVTKFLLELFHVLRAGQRLCFCGAAISSRHCRKRLLY